MLLLTPCFHACWQLIKVREDAGTWWCDCERLKQGYWSKPWRLSRMYLHFRREALTTTSTSPPPLRRPRALCVITRSHELSLSGGSRYTPFPSYAPCPVIKYCITRFARDSQLLQLHTLFCFTWCRLLIAPPPFARLTHSPRHWETLPNPAQTAQKQKQPKCLVASHARSFLENSPREHLHALFYI